MKVTKQRVEFIAKHPEERLHRQLSPQEQERISMFIQWKMQYWLEPFLQEFIDMIFAFINDTTPVVKTGGKKKPRRKLRPVKEDDK